MHVQDYMYKISGWANSTLDAKTLTIGKFNFNLRYHSLLTLHHCTIFLVYFKCSVVDPWMDLGGHLPPPSDITTTAVRGTQSILELPSC